MRLRRGRPAAFRGAIRVSASPLSYPEPGDGAGSSPDRWSRTLGTFSSTIRRGSVSRAGELAEVIDGIRCPEGALPLRRRETTGRCGTDCRLDRTPDLEGRGADAPGPRRSANSARRRLSSPVPPRWAIPTVRANAVPDGPRWRVRHHRAGFARHTGRSNAESGTVRASWPCVQIARTTTLRRS